MSFINEFFKSIFRVFGRVVAYIIIGAIIYFIASRNIFAAQYRILNRDSDTPTTSWTNISFNTDYTNTPIILNTSGKTVFQLRDNVAMASGKKYDLKLQFDFTGYATAPSNNIDVIVSVATEIFNGSELVSIADKCVTNYSQFDETTYNNGIYTASHRILGTITCSGVEGTGYYPYFGFQIKRNNVLIAGKGSAKLRFLTWTYTLNTSDTNTQSIITNQNNNTQSIINNNNYNTSQITGSIGDLKDSLTDTTPPSDYSFFNDIGLSNDTPISNLILMPITLLSAFNSGVNGTCSPVSLGVLLGTELTLPCINLENKLGSNLWGYIDLFFSIFMIYELGMLVVSVFNDITSLRDGFDSLYVPKHEDKGYKPRHAKE